VTVIAESISTEEIPGPVRHTRESVTRLLLRSPVAIVCLTYLLLLGVVAVLAPILLPDVATQHAGNLRSANLAPGSEHLLGTDDLGRDVLARLLVGTRITILAVAEAVSVAALVGVPLGVCAGYFGGRVDRFVTWSGDLVLSIPAIAMLLVVLAVFPGSTSAAMCALGLLLAPSMMRVVRSAALPIREEPYIAAARVSGLSHPRILARHVTPRLGGVVIIQGSLMAGQSLLALSGLAFLGMVAPAPAPSWGGMVSDGARVVLTNSWLIWPAGVLIAITVLAFGLLGDLLRDATTAAWANAGAVHRKQAKPTARLRDQRGSAAERQVDRALLCVDGLTVSLNSPSSSRTVLQEVSLEVRQGESVALVGESGCGKSITALSILGLLPGAARVESGSVWFEGRDLTTYDEAELRRVRGNRIGFVSQEPMVSLNPAFTIGTQLVEIVRRHHGGSRREARQMALDLLRRVHLPSPEIVAKQYPHQLSGGMAQRVSIARALAGAPVLLIADEPTTALDVTVQAGILDLFRELQADGMSLLFVTHNWGVAADMCDRAIVMYAGEIVERAPLEPILENPRHPYTAALLNSDPHRASERGRLPTIAGTVPPPGLWPQGCHFSPRCTMAKDACREAPIPLVPLAADRDSRCIRVHELQEKM
jgi:peptide/nickel transport system permease protein